MPPEDADLLAEIAAEVPESSSEPLDQQTAILSDIDSRISAQSVEDDWESLPAPSALPSSPRLAPSSKVRPLHRTDECALDFQLSHLDLDFSTFPSSSPTACLLNIAAGSLNVVDHIKTSTWNMFMTELRTQDGGFARPTDSPMLRVQYAQDRSLSNKRATEERLKARISPLRLHVDQDAIDFLKSFFAFKAPSQSTTPPPESEAAVPAFISASDYIFGVSNVAHILM